MNYDGKNDDVARELIAGLATRSGQPVDEHGNPVKRTKERYPYSYDGFVIWRTEGKANDTVYSDRLLEWDFTKHDKLCMKHFGNAGQYWTERDPKKVEAFLRDWYDNPKLKLIFIMQYCNLSSGYPCWRFDFNTNKENYSDFMGKLKDDEVIDRGDK